MIRLTPPPPYKGLAAAFLIATLALRLDPAHAQTDFSTNIDTAAVAKNESQAIADWGQRVCITATLNTDGTGVAAVAYGATDGEGQATTENINAWNIAKDAGGYPGRRYTDFNGNPTNVFRGVTVADGEDHIGNVYWTSSSSTTGMGTFKAMQPIGYGRRNELWVEIDTPTIRVNRYKSLGSGAIGKCGDG